MGHFVWFEHMPTDVQRVRIIDGTLSGSGSEGMPESGSVCHMARNCGEGIGGYRSAPPNTPVQQGT